MRFVDKSLITPIKYDDIRGSIESAFSRHFNPGRFAPATTYPVGAKVQLGGIVYEALAETSATPPSADWRTVGPVYLVIYENVKTGIPANGGIKIEIHWQQSDFVSIPCPQGQMKENNGMLMVWIFTPVNKGTKESALICERLSELFLSFEDSGNGLCGSAVRIYNPSGPKRSRVNTEQSFNAQVVSASLKAFEMT